MAFELFNKDTNNQNIVNNNEQPTNQVEYNPLLVNQGITMDQVSVSSFGSSYGEEIINKTEPSTEGLKTNNFKNDIPQYSQIQNQNIQQNPVYYERPINNLVSYNVPPRSPLSNFPAPNSVNNYQVPAGIRYNNFPVQQPAFQNNNSVTPNLMVNNNQTSPNPVVSNNSNINTEFTIPQPIVNTQAIVTPNSSNSENNQSSSIMEQTAPNIVEEIIDDEIESNPDELKKSKEEIKEFPQEPDKEEPVNINNMINNLINSEDNNSDVVTNNTIQPTIIDSPILKQPNENPTSSLPITTENFEQQPENVVINTNLIDSLTNNLTNQSNDNIITNGDTFDELKEQIGIDFKPKIEPVEAGFKRCPKCGQKMREDYRQCFVCGTYF